MPRGSPLDRSTLDLRSVIRPTLHRTVSLPLACLFLVLLAFPLTLGKPGLPPNLKADESAYYLMALSLFHDRDLRLEVQDVDRVFHEYPYGAVRNLIAMTDDGWQNVYFGKPYIYSLFAAPFAGPFGADGMMFFNMLMLVSMIWMGSQYLQRFNERPVSEVFAAAFFLLANAAPYVFWLHPEVFNMASITACLYLAFTGASVALPSESGDRRALLRAAASGAVLALAVYNKPMFALLGAAPLVAYLWPGQSQASWRLGGRRAAAWVFGAILGMALISGLAQLLTGHPSSYLGVSRQGVTVCEPGKIPAAVVPLEVVAEESGDAGLNSAAAREREAVEHSPTGNAWSWMFRVPQLIPGEFFENLSYFLWGRHTGLLLYMPFAVLAVGLFGRQRWQAWRARREAPSRDAGRWTLLAGLVGVALFFLLFIFFNWHGGGGFIGNRYYVSVYPAFLFLVTVIRPRWLLLPACLFGGLFLAPLLITPFGSGVPEPTLQAHVRNAPFRFFPLELSLRNVPGYETARIGDLRLRGRKDVFLPQGDEIWLHGATRTEIYVLSAEPLEQVTFELRSPAPDNEVRLWLGSPWRTQQYEYLHFTQAEQVARLQLDAGEPYRVRTLRQYDDATDDMSLGKNYVYRLVIETSNGRVRPWTRFYPPNPCPYFTYDETRQENFLVGVGLAWLGTEIDLDADLYNVRWGQIDAPGSVTVGERFQLGTRVFNQSALPWPGGEQAPGAARVKLSYRWLDPAGELVPGLGDGERTELPGTVEPGERVALRQDVLAPTAPGSYLLELDLVYERIAWFSQRNGGTTQRIPIEVRPEAGIEEDTP